MKENRLSPTIAKLTLFQLEISFFEQSYNSPQILSIQKLNVLAYSSVPAFEEGGGVMAACFLLFDASSHFVVNGKGTGLPTNQCTQPPQTFSSKGKRT